MKTLIKKFVESKCPGAWAPTTARSATHRLNGVANLLNGEPETLWKGVQDQRPYSRVTTFANVIVFWDWLIRQGHQEGVNPYRVWRDENPRHFKNKYQSKHPAIGYVAAERLILKIKCTETKERALQLLYSGMRVSEPETLDENGMVVGKGNKPRKVHVGPYDRSQHKEHYRTFLRKLKDATNLTPHDLRKIMATNLAEQGANPFQMCQIFGWSDPKTAMRYINSSDNSISNLMENARKNGK